MVRQFPFIMILVFILVDTHILALADDDPFRGPWKRASVMEEKAGAQILQKKEKPQSIFQKSAVKGIGFFQKIISPTDGDRCPLYPSCSAYGAQAVRKHGFVLGIIMTTARLTHERGEMRISPKIRVHGSYRFYDPLENNDFWFTIE